MHLLKTDLEYGTIVSSGRKSVTIQADAINFKLRRVVRKPYERVIKNGLEKDLGKDGYKRLHRDKQIVTDSLAAWPPQFPLAKFSIQRVANTFWLTALDEKSTDSYLLKTLEWSLIHKALLSLSDGRVNLPDPQILEVANPFACYAPFEPPAWHDFENVNAEVRGVLNRAIGVLLDQQSAGYVSPKIATRYLQLLAEVEALDLLPSLIPPLIDDFESAE